MSRTTRKLWGRQRAQRTFFRHNGYYPGLEGRRFAVFEQMKDIARTPMPWRILARLLYGFHILIKSIGCSRLRYTWRVARLYESDSPALVGNQLKMRGRA